MLTAVANGYSSGTQIIGQILAYIEDILSQYCANELCYNQMLLPENILETYNHVGEVAHIMQIQLKIIGNPVNRTDILLPTYSKMRDPMTAPKRRPSGNREAIQDPSSFVMRNGGSSPVNCAK